MLTNINVVSSGGNVQLRYGTYFPPSGYMIEDVEGLGPPDTDLHISSYANLAGGVLSASNITSRNIVLKISVDSTTNQSVFDLRRELYRAMMPGEEVRLYLWDSVSGTYRMQIDGYVESILPSMFTKKPELTVSILCPFPYFSSPELSEKGPYGRGSVDIDYYGDVPAGFVSVIDINTSGLTSLDIRSIRAAGDEVITITSDQFTSGRSVRIDTGAGTKTATLRNASGATTHNLMRTTSSNGAWPTLSPGRNTLRYLSHPTGPSGDISWIIRYRELYGGF